MNKNAKTRRSSDAEAVKQQDFITNKLLSVLTLAFVLVFAFIFIGRRMRRADMYYTMFLRGMWVVAGIFAALMVIGIVWHFVAKKKGVDYKYKLCSGKNVAICSGFIALCFASLAISYTPETLKLIYVAIAAVTLLYIIYHSYPFEFFATSASTGIGAIGVWLICNALNGGVGQTLFPILAGVLVLFEVAVIVFTAIAAANGGKLMKKALYKENAKYWTVFLGAALVLAALAATFVLGGAYIYILSGALLGYIVLTGIIYTVNMI